jgi:UPF0716 family protein affecting phage T7 exclusion
METLKLAGGTIIVLAAAAIMFPGFLQVAFSLWRILLIVVIAGGACLALAHARLHLAKMKNNNQPAATATDGTSTQV